MTLDTQRPRFTRGFRFRAEEGADAPEAKLAPNGEAYDIAFVASTERLASDGGVIRTAGWRFDSFMKNPRFIAMHDIHGQSGVPMTQMAVGTVVHLEKRSDLPIQQSHNGKGVVAYVRFARTAFGRDMRTLYLDGDLDAVSVRWDPFTEEARAPYQEEVNEYGAALNWVAERTDLLELSAVILGADPGAVALRGEVIQAMARCRAAGHHLAELSGMLEGQGVDLDAAFAHAAEEELADRSAIDLDGIFAEEGVDTEAQHHVTGDAAAEDAQVADAGDSGDALADAEGGAGAEAQAEEATHAGAEEAAREEVIPVEAAESPERSASPSEGAGEDDDPTRAAAAGGDAAEVQDPQDEPEVREAAATAVATREVDASAYGDALEALSKSLEVLDRWMDAFGGVRQALADSQSALSALVAGEDDPEIDGLDAIEGQETGEEERGAVPEPVAPEEREAERRAANLLTRVEAAVDAFEALLTRAAKTGGLKDEGAEEDDAGTVEVDLAFLAQQGAGSAGAR